MLGKIGDSVLLTSIDYTKSTFVQLIGEFAVFRGVFEDSQKWMRVVRVQRFISKMPHGSYCKHYDYKKSLNDRIGLTFGL